ncbi:MAG: hypothetical protein ACXWR0_18915 [Bdellovibrio sp.]
MGDDVASGHKQEVLGRGIFVWFEPHHYSDKSCSRTVSNETRTDALFVFENVIASLE